MVLYKANPCMNTLNKLMNSLVRCKLRQTTLYTKYIGDKQISTTCYYNKQIQIQKTLKYFREKKIYQVDKKTGKAMHERLL